jgi:hypothetical protein
MNSNEPEVTEGALDEVKPPPELGGLPGLEPFPRCASTLPDKAKKTAIASTIEKREELLFIAPSTGFRLPDCFPSCVIRGRYGDDLRQGILTLFCGSVRKNPKHGFSLGKLSSFTFRLELS